MTRAPKVCTTPGCPAVADPGTSHCPQHTRPPWRNSNRAQELPPNWQTLRAAILQRDQRRCTCPGCPNCTNHPCTAPGTEVDHLGDKHDHRPQSLATKCTACHRHRTQQQAHGR